MRESANAVWLAAHPAFCLTIISSTSRAPSRLSQEDHASGEDANGADGILEASLFKRQ